MKSEAREGNALSANCAKLNANGKPGVAWFKDVWELAENGNGMRVAYA